MEICTFQLNVATRLMLLMNMPEQGSVVDMINKRNVKSKIDFSSEEMNQLKMRNEDGKIIWENEIEAKSVEFIDSEIEFLKSIIKKLDETGQITDNILDFVTAIYK